MLDTFSVGSHLCFSSESDVFSIIRPSKLGFTSCIPSLVNVVLDRFSEGRLLDSLSVIDVLSLVKSRNI